MRTLFVCGADDGCAMPFPADGQEALFTAGYRTETWTSTGDGDGDRDEEGAGAHRRSIAIGRDPGRR